MEELYEHIEKHLDKSTQGFIRGLLCFDNGDTQDHYVKTTLQERPELFIQEMRAVDIAIQDNQWLTKEKHTAKKKLMEKKEQMETVFDIVLAWASFKIS